MLITIGIARSSCRAINSSQELSAITYELFAGRTKYSPKREDMYAKLLQRDMSWLMNDMIWSNESETESE